MRKTSKTCILILKININIEDYSDPIPFLYLTFKLQWVSNKKINRISGPISDCNGYNKFRYKQILFSMLTWLN